MGVSFCFAKRLPRLAVSLAYFALAFSAAFKARSAAWSAVTDYFSLSFTSTLAKLAELNTVEKAWHI